jgi:hypothetical protein
MVYVDPDRLIGAEGLLIVPLAHMYTTPNEPGPPRGSEWAADACTPPRADASKIETTTVANSDRIVELFGLITRMT